MLIFLDWPWCVLTKNDQISLTKSFYGIFTRFSSKCGYPVFGVCGSLLKRYCQSEGHIKEFHKALGFNGMILAEI
jgi:hypothetical protein